MKGKYDKILSVEKPEYKIFCANCYCVSAKFTRKEVEFANSLDLNVYCSSACKESNHRGNYDGRFRSPEEFREDLRC